ncbi:MAG: hypothetical protein EBW25_06470 [Actinobacteria bacterium]|nr:hypothetical protein [Actinomycetota bacterium]
MPIASNNLEIPVAICYQLAGSAIQAILQLIDTGKSDLTGAQMVIDYLTPIRQLPTYIARRPNCRCQWITEENLKKSTSAEREVSASASMETIPF